jgi:TP901 family phage tail tape measure protein
MLSGVTSMFAGLVPAAATEGAAAGETAGEGFASRFASMMSGVTSAFSGLLPGMEAEGASAGAAAGEGFGSRFKSAIMGDLSPLEVLMGAGFVAATAMMASHFDAAMELVHTQAGVAQSAIAGLSGGVLDLAGKVGESPDSLAHALYHVESSFQSVGITGQAAMSLLQTAAEGAREGNANLVDVTNALDATIASGIGGINNYSQAMGALNAIVGAGDMSMQDLADAMGSGLMAVAKSYGQSIYDIGAALATFGDNNIRGAKAATDLRMAMQAILAPVKTGESYLQHLGLTMTSLGDTMTHKGLTAAIAEFVQHLEAAKVPVSDWGEYVTNIFGKKAGAGIGVLVDQLGRLQSKMPDIKHGAESFASAWSATEATTSQKLHELEAGFQALMIRIGNGLLPAVDSLMSMITRNLPTIEHFGTEIAHLVAPVVTVFFTGLESILKFLLGPMRDVTIAVAALAAGWAALNFVMNLNPFVAIGTALVLLVGVIVKYHKQIVDAIHKYWHEIEAFLAGLALAFPVVAALVALVALVIKYHQQIFDAIKMAWDKVTAFFKGLEKAIVDPVKRTFDEVKKAITGGFDQWWKSHGKEIEEVWKAAWTAIKAYFTLTWNLITSVVQTSWDTLMGILKPGLDLLLMVVKTAWDAIAAVFKTAWDIISAVVKVAVAGIESVIKIGWDTLAGIFNVFLDLITGHWSKAWTDIKNTATQVWNAIKTFLGSVWNAISSLVMQVVNNIKNFLVQSWNDIKSGVVSAFNDVRHTIASIWDGILHDIESVVDKIKSVVSSIVSLPGHVIGSVLGAVGLAGGGVIPGYAPGHDIVNAKLSPGEAVLVPEAVRAIGPDRINAINAHYSAGRGGGYSFGGVVPDPYGGTSPAGHTRGGDGYAYGGIFPSGGGQQTAGSGTTASGGNVFNVSFYGTQWPNAEQVQALKIDLATAVGAAG